MRPLHLADTRTGGHPHSPCTGPAEHPYLVLKPRGVHAYPQVRAQVSRPSAPPGARSSVRKPLSLARIRTNRTHRRGSRIRTSSPGCSKNETNRPDGGAVADPVGCTPAAERGQSKASVAPAHISVKKSSFSVLPGVNRGEPGSGTAMVCFRRLTSGGVAVHVGRLPGHTRVRSRGHSGRVASWWNPSGLS